MDRAVKTPCFRADHIIKEICDMQNEQDRMDRRGFLRISAAGAMAAAVHTALPLSVSGQEAPSPIGKRVLPASPLKLRSAHLEAWFDREDGLPVQFHLPGNQAVLAGEDAGMPLTATVCHKPSWEFADLRASRPVVKSTATSAEFRFQMDFGGSRAAGFTVRYVVEDASIVITLEAIEEAAGFELISVNLPRLVSILDSDPQGWLVHGDTGGSFATLAQAKAGTLPTNQFWGNVAGTLPLLMLGHAHAMCVQETTAYMDATLLTVTREGSRARASIGTAQVHRVNGSLCYDLNLPKGMPKNCGTKATPNVLVEQKSSCRLDFLPVTGRIEDAWLQGAKLVRNRMPAIRSNLYHDKYVYGIRCDEPLFPKPTATFAECETLIRDVNRLTDGAAQIVHLWGWQFKGKDTGYPAVNEVNARIGGYDGMMQLMEAGHGLNALVTLSDNYDDAYRSSPAWDEAVVARRPDGQLWKSRSWTGEESYILGMAKYMEGPGVERVRYTCDRYKLRETTHVDVLSYYAIRNDWDPEKPASGIRNLTAGRYRVLDEFAKHGVDVTSEALRYPMIGRISNFWYAQASGNCPLGGTTIPLLPMVYRRSAVWGYSGGSQADRSLERFHQLFYGACPHSILHSDVDRKQITDTWYLALLPWIHLHPLAIETFEREGQRTTIGLESNSSILIDWEKRTYRVHLHGVEIAREDSVSCPIGQDKFAFYATSARELRAPLPAGWDQKHLVANALSTAGPRAVPLRVEGGSMIVAVEAQSPVIVRRQ